MSNQIPARTQTAAVNSLRQYADALGDDWFAQAANRLLNGLKSIINPAEETRGTPEGDTKQVETGDTPATVRADLVSGLLRRYENGAALAEEMNLDFKIGTALDISGGAKRFLLAQSDVDEYPAWALSRFYDRDVPRGFKRGPKGVLEPVEDDDWPARWAAAGAACGDDDWLDWEGDSQTGRGVALKSSGIWQALGDGEGGYDDTLGNSFPPFAFNSGFDVDGVPYKECVELGLLDQGEQADPADYDPTNLFSLS